VNVDVLEEGMQGLCLYDVVVLEEHQEGLHSSVRVAGLQDAR